MAITKDWALQAQIDRLTKDRDHWIEEADRLGRLLNEAERKAELGQRLMDLLKEINSG